MPAKRTLDDATALLVAMNDEHNETGKTRFELDAARELAELPPRGDRFKRAVSLLIEEGMIRTTWDGTQLVLRREE